MIPVGTLKMKSFQGMPVEDRVLPVMKGFISSVYLREPRRIGEESGEQAVPEENGALSAEEEKLLLCVFCGAGITSRRDGIEIHGGGVHTFLNPAGLIYTIGCFSRAEGCIVLGDPVHDFTWFRDYNWSVALCRECGRHLGWFYRGDGPSFFGLILDYLVEAS